jgi:uncharacterized CHY-type Zn-finger protein
MNCNSKTNCYDCRDNMTCRPFQEYIRKENENQKMFLKNNIKYSA